MASTRDIMPLLPGYDFSSFESFAKGDHRKKPRFKFLNGFRVACDDGEISADEVSSPQFTGIDPNLTYGRRKPLNLHENKRFVPHYAMYDRKCLRFDAYFRQGPIAGSAIERDRRVRHVRLLYYLEDDTMCVHQPKTFLPNVGFDDFDQGKLVKRHKVPKPRSDEFYHWKDLNVAEDIEIYGIVHHIYNCDSFTREFLTSQGIDVADPDELVPVDPYLNEREIKPMIGSPQPITEISPDSKTFYDNTVNEKLRQFIEFDRKVLTFDAKWQDDLYKLRFFLGDGTISIMSVEKGQRGRSCLLKNTKVPKNWSDAPKSEISLVDNLEYYSACDLKVGETIFIFGRRFFLYDCDRFTRRYYKQVMNVEQPARIMIPELCDPNIDCAKLYSDKKHADDTTVRFIRQLYNFPKRLRYKLKMEAVHPEDKDRDFILEYNLADGRMRIQEVDKRNSGRRAGCFLSLIKVPKPGNNNSGGGECYTPVDFVVGARLNVFEHWFVVTGTELYVWNYIDENRDKFPESVRDNIRQWVAKEGLLEELGCGSGKTQVKSEMAEDENANLEDCC